MVKKEIYDCEEVYYYILHSVIPVTPPKFNYIAKKIYFEFDKAEIKELYEKWNNF